MKTVISNWQNLSQTAGFLQDFLRLRYSLFVKKLGWRLDCCGGLEFDQYDTPYCTYILVTLKNKTIAGTRLIRTDTKTTTGFTYMINDASRGKLKSIPKCLMEEPPTNADAWEATRFTVCGALTVTDKNLALQEVCRAAVKFVRSQNGSVILGLMHPFYIRWFEKLGYSVCAAGPTVCIEGDKFCVIQ